VDSAEVYERLNEAYFSEDPHERDVLQHLPLLLREEMLFGDVGASLGAYTRRVAEHAPAARIVAIEADPLRAAELERTTRTWGDRVRVEQMAASDAAGTATFHVTDSPVSGGLTPHEVAEDVAWRPITVPTSTLDQLFAADAPDLIKIDVEGAEGRVLAGARALLEAGRTNWLIELHEWAPADGSPDKVRALMHSHGYRYIPFFGMPLFTRSRRLAVSVLARQPGRIARAARNRLTGS